MAAQPREVNDRQARIRHVIDECMRRRVAGEALTDNDISRAHADLMPELGRELHKLALIERARGRAQAPADSSSGTMNEPAPCGRVMDAGRDRATARLSISSLADSFAGYDIIREIHRGGQGVVYEAVQKATRRPVAIKVMHEGPFAAAKDKLRFEREVQILGQLRHPNIVTIHDSGSAAGSAYFVMDYIAGAPLDQYVRGVATAKADLRELLRLFAKIGEAVNFAHLRGVIHRDLKPGNIRVDENGEPHVLDFGLARVETTEGTEDAESNGECLQTVTVSGQFVGSFPWASPEQARGRRDEIDVRTDVYSLGVMLFQMLTGRFPYPVTGQLRDVLDNIERAQPVRPSTLNRRIDNEVETIVLKCLNKERERRYQSAGELARDLRRYLDGEPIEAKRDSNWYMLKKILRRYRARTAVAAGFVVLIGISAVALGVMYGRQKRERERAVAAEQIAAKERTDALAARDAESDARKRSEREASRALQVQNFLTSMLHSVDPRDAVGPDVTVREVLDRAAQDIDRQLSAEPEIEATIRLEIAKSYVAIGRYQAAEPHAQAALDIREQLFGRNHLAVAEALDELGIVWSNLGRLADAEKALREALSLVEHLSPDDQLSRAAVLSNLASTYDDMGEHSRAEEMYREALDVRRELAGPDSTAVSHSLNTLACALQDQGKLDEAEPLLREALALRRAAAGDRADRNTRVAETLNNLAGVLRLRGNYAEAETLMREAIAIDERALGAEHPTIASGRKNLAILLTNRGDFAAAEELHRQALALRRKLLGEEHPEVAESMQLLGGVLTRKGALDEAEALLRRALELQQRIFGEHPQVASVLNELGGLLKQRGDFEGAERLLREAIALRRKLLGDDDRQTIVSIVNLGALLVERGDAAEAEVLFREVLALNEATLGADHPETAAALNNLAAAVGKQDRYAEAEPLYRRALDIGIRRLGEGHPDFAYGLTNLALAVNRLGHVTEAEALYRRALTIRLERFPEDHPEVASGLSNLGNFLVDTARAAEAEPMLRRALAIRREKLPAAHVLTLTVAGTLADGLVALGQFDEAELSALECYEGLAAAKGPSHKSTRAAAERLVKLYSAWGKPDAAAEYQPE